MEIIHYRGMHNLKNVDSTLGTDSIRLFNHVEYQYSNPYVNSIKLADKPTCDSSAKLINLLLDLLLDDQTENITKTQILKYFMINRQKLDLIDAPEKKAKLVDFVTKTMNGCEHQNYIETLIKKNDA